MYVCNFNTELYDISPKCFGVLYTPSSDRTSNYLHNTYLRSTARCVYSRKQMVL